MASNLITKLPKGVVLGHILKVARHPQADRLNVCRVALSPSPKSLLPDPAANNPTDRLAAEGNMGRAAQTIVQIVCGAPNVAERQIVPVATVGTLLPLPEEEGQEEEKAREEESPVPAPTAVECEAGGQDQSQPETKKKKKKKKQKKKAKGFKIKKSKLRGEVSMGMICSAKELQLSEDHEGILVLGHLQLEQLSDITRRVGGGSAEEEERETTKTMEPTGASADPNTDTGAARGGAKDDGEVIDLQSVHTDPLNDWIGRPLSEWIEEKNPQF